MKVLVVFLLSVCWSGLGSTSPLIADVLKASMRNGGVSSMNNDPLYEEANYNFQYMVRDPDSGNDFGHQEVRSGDMATGSYYQMMPDGRMQRVDYVADRDGYRPMVVYEGEPRYGAGAGLLDVRAF